MEDMTANRRLRQLMRERGLCSEDLALRCGMDRRGIERAVLELRPIYADELWGLASALGVTVERLLV